LLLLNLSFVLLYVRDPFAERNAARVANFTRTLVTSLVKFVKEVYASFWLSGRGPIVGVAFSLLPAGAMALAYATLATIQVDYGLDENQIARLQTLNTLFAAAGCIAGGMFGDRFGAKRAIAIAYALTAAVSFALATQISQIGLVAVAPSFFYGVIIAHGFFFGMAYGARNAIYMSMTNPAVAATQFTAFMGMSNLAISVGNYWQGIVAERMGYAQVLYLDAGIALLVICLIPFLRARDASSERADPAVDSALPAPVPVAD